MTLFTSINLWIALNLPRQLSCRLNSRKCRGIVFMVVMITMLLFLIFWKDSDADSNYRIVKLSDLSEKSVCAKHKTYKLLDNTTIFLNQEPFAKYVMMTMCKSQGNIATFGDSRFQGYMFAVFRNIMVDPSRATFRHRERLEVRDERFEVRGKRSEVIVERLEVRDERFEVRGKSTKRSEVIGEKLEGILDKPDVDEHLSLKKGYFIVPCIRPLRLTFGSRGNEAEHPFKEWVNSMKCFGEFTGPSRAVVIKEYTLAIKRYSPANFFHCMCDYYNAFVLMMIFGIRPSNLNIMFVDTHPVSSLDHVWDKLFRKVIRAGHLETPVLFHNLIWGMPGMFSPLNETSRDSVPYLEYFREFFLTKHNVSASHIKDCGALKVVFIWRHSHAAHPTRDRAKNVTKIPAIEAEMLRVAHNTLGSTANVTGHQMDTMSMEAQLGVIATCDILIGVHGAGLSHILFLPKTSTVLELQPEIELGQEKNHFWAQVRWRGISYSVLDGWHTRTNVNNSEAQALVPAVQLGIKLNRIRRRMCD